MGEQNCDCGFAIPDRAQFCPGCGKPLTSDARERERIANAFPLRPEESAEGGDEISFSTPAALRSCYWSAAVAVILCSLPLISALFFIIFPAAGFASVASFRRKTGKLPDLRGGVKLGLMTGVLAFMLLLLLITFAVLLPGSAGYAEIFTGVADELERMGNTEAAGQLRELIEEPDRVATLMLTVLAMFSVMLIGLATAGGALGAKVLGRAPSERT